MPSLLKKDTAACTDSQALTCVCNTNLANILTFRLLRYCSSQLANTSIPHPRRKFSHFIKILGTGLDHYRSHGCQQLQSSTLQSWQSLKADQVELLGTNTWSKASPCWPISPVSIHHASPSVLGPPASITRPSCLRVPLRTLQQQITAVRTVWDRQAPHALQEHKLH